MKQIKQFIDIVIWVLLCIAFTSLVSCSTIDQIEPTEIVKQEPVNDSTWTLVSTTSTCITTNVKIVMHDVVQNPGGLPTDSIGFVTLINSCSLATADVSTMQRAWQINSTDFELLNTESTFYSWADNTHNRMRLTRIIGGYGWAYNYNVSYNGDKTIMYWQQDSGKRVTWKRV